MCFPSPSPPQDDSAAIAQQQEASRQANVQTGINTINTAFTPFDSSYYDGIKNAYLSYEQPQLNDQFDQAQRSLSYALDRAGTANSSAGAYQTGLLQTAYDRSNADLTNQAQDQANSQQAAVATEKNNLLNLNTTAADPSSTEAATTAGIQTIQTPQSFSPLGNMFAGIINTAGIGAAASNQAGLNQPSVVVGPNGQPVGTGQASSGSSYTVQ